MTAIDMTVKDLRRALAKMPPEAKVVFAYYITGDEMEGSQECEITGIKNLPTEGWTGKVVLT